ncbi:hypothetical protein BC831DRAFT_282731 [Entophlyctis helioformis]|nr:hypothetical protein BC831DRAFT_282731 [Entophlyctis helioformis]
MSDPMQIDLDSVIKAKRQARGRRAPRGGAASNAANAANGNGSQRTARSNAPLTTPAGRQARAAAPLTTAGGSASSAVAASADKLVVSNLAFTVTEHDVKALFSRIGPLRSAQLNYNSEGKSKGVATVIFSKQGDAARAYAEYNGRTLDERVMKIELIVNPEAPALRVAPAVSATPRRTTTGTVGKARGSPGQVGAAGGDRRGGRDGGRRGGRRGGRGGAAKTPVTTGDLDAEMDAYMNDSAAPAADHSQLANALA